MASKAMYLRLLRLCYRMSGLCKYGIGKPEIADCAKLCLDCAEISRLCTAFCARGSRFPNQVSQLCADIREACARECEKYDDEQMKRYTEGCRRCAKLSFL